MSMLDNQSDVAPRRQTATTQDVTPPHPNDLINTQKLRIGLGDKGDKGDKGDPGDKGDRGDPGPKGDDGADGKDGKDGVCRCPEGPQPTDEAPPDDGGGDPMIPIIRPHTSGTRAG